MTEYTTNLIIEKARRHFDNEMLLLELIKSLDREGLDRLSEVLYSHAHVKNIGEVHPTIIKNILDRINGADAP